MIFPYRSQNDWNETKLTRTRGFRIAGGTSNDSIRRPGHKQIWTPLRRFGPPPPIPYFPLSIVCMATNSICKLFADVLFHHNTTFLNKGKEKQPFRF